MLCSFLALGTCWETFQAMNNAPINVMPHYHRYGLRWEKVGVCIPENYNSPPTGEVLEIQAPTYLDKSPSSKTQG